jgi:hypothetical protein
VCEREREREREEEREREFCSALKEFVVKDLIDMF